ncbi:MAG: hypothetical protein QM703_25865 [Gemmatales bacterium]
MRNTRLRTKLDSDGVLRLDLSLGEEAANREVDVTIELLPPAMTQEEWKAWVEKMAGTWEGEFEVDGDNARIHPV